MDEKSQEINEMLKLLMGNAEIEQKKIAVRLKSFTYNLKYVICQYIYSLCFLKMQTSNKFKDFHFCIQQKIKV